MAYVNKYIMQFNNEVNEFYEVYFDYLNYTGSSSYITGAEDCLVIRCTTGDEDKFSPVLGTEALINIWVGINDTIDITDLIAINDNQIRITVYKDQVYTSFIYQGFIVVEDNSQPFLDRPFQLSLRALDGLGLLKTVDFVDANNVRFTGTQSVVSWLGQILAKTGQTMNLRTAFSFYPAGVAFTSDPLAYINIHEYTFYTGELAVTTDPSVDVNAADNCYDALEKFARCFRCRIFQEDGRWNFINLYEYAAPNGMTFFEYAISQPSLITGLVSMTPVSYLPNVDLSTSVGKNAITVPANNDAILYLKQLYKWVKLSYNYDQSLNKICNQTFVQLGVSIPSYNEMISDEIIDPDYDTNTTANPLSTFGYQMYCWQNFDGGILSTFGPFPPSAPSKRCFIRTVIDVLGYEITRFGVLDHSSTLAGIAFAQATQLLIDAGDIIQVSMSFRLRNKFIQNTATPILAVYLYGDDGTFWALRCNDDNSKYNLDRTQTLAQTKWLQTDSNFHGLGGLATYYVATGDLTGVDTSQWQTISANFTLPDKVPVNGMIQILVLNDFGDVGNEFWFKNLTVNILPYLLGSFQELSGDYNFGQTSNNVKQTDSQDVQISDSPKRYFKGALLQPSGVALIPPTWSRRGTNESFRFTQAMLRIIYNNEFKMRQKIEGTMRGMVYQDKVNPILYHPNGFLNSWFFVDGLVPSKKFILTSFEKDFGTATFRGVFVEVLSDQNENGWQVEDFTDFQYVFTPPSDI